MPTNNILLLGAVLVALAAGAYVLISQQQEGPVVVQPDVTARHEGAIETPTPKTATASQEEWNTYRDTAVGFSFEYPKEWTVSNPWTRSSGKPGTDYSAGVCLNPHGDCYGIVNVFKGEVLSEVIESRRSRLAQFGSVSETRMVVAGHEAVVLTVAASPIDGLDPNTREVIFAKGDYIYEFTMNHDHEAVLDHILATFTFL